MRDICRDAACLVGQGDRGIKCGTVPHDAGQLAYLPPTVGDTRSQVLSGLRNPGHQIFAANRKVEGVNP